MYYIKIYSSRDEEVSVNDACQKYWSRKEKSGAIMITTEHGAPGNVWENNYLLGCPTDSEDDNRYFEVAYVMNIDGKTIETIRPEMLLSRGSERD